MPHDSICDDPHRDATLPPARDTHVCEDRRPSPEPDGGLITERFPMRRVDESTLRTRPTDPLPPSGPMSMAPLRDDPTWQAPVIAARKLRNELERLCRAAPEGDEPEDQVRIATFHVLNHLFHVLDEFANRAIRREPYRLLVNDNGRTPDSASIDLVIVRDERL